MSPIPIWLGSGFRISSSPDKASCIAWDAFFPADCSFSAASALVFGLVRRRVGFGLAAVPAPAASPRVPAVASFFFRGLRGFFSSVGTATTPARVGTIFARVHVTTGSVSASGSAPAIFALRAARSRAISARRSSSVRSAKRPGFFAGAAGFFGAGAGLGPRSHARAAFASGNVSLPPAVLVAIQVPSDISWMKPIFSLVFNC